MIPRYFTYSLYETQDKSNTEFLEKAAKEGFAPYRVTPTDLGVMVIFRATWWSRLIAWLSW